MKIGTYELHSIETGRFALDGGAMFGVVPKSLWEKSNPPDERNRITMSARALLLVGDGRRILVDVGNGSKYSEKLMSIYKFDMSKNNLISSLQCHHLSPDDITDVILTHLHFDHAGGSTSVVHKEIVPTFPKARYYVQREHWLAAITPTERDRASFFPHDFLPLRDNLVLEFTGGEHELFPGITVKVLNGHTTALQSPVITDGNTTLFFCADLVPTASHLALPWIMAYDLRPLVTLEEKKRILTQAVDEQWILYFEHDPGIEAGRLVRNEHSIVLGTPLKVG